jgi:hypothetical protein
MTIEAMIVAVVLNTEHIKTWSSFGRTISPEQAGI